MRRWVKVYRRNGNDVAVSISKRRGRPLSLPNELDTKLRSFLLNLRKAGGVVNKFVVKGVLMGLIRSNMVQFGAYADFKVTRGWTQYLYKRMNFTQRMVTTSRPPITKVIFEKEVKRKFLHNIAKKVVEHNIPDKVIFNVDQTPSKYIPSTKVTMSQRGGKHVAITGSSDKRTITATYVQTLAGDILPSSGN